MTIPTNSLNRLTGDTVETRIGVLTFDFQRRRPSAKSSKEGLFDGTWALPDVELTN